MRENPSVIDYPLVDVEFGSSFLDFEALHVLGSDHSSIKRSLQISWVCNLNYLPHVICKTQAQVAKMLHQDWSEEETKIFKARFYSEDILDQLKGLSDSSLDPNIVTVSLTQFLHEEVGMSLETNTTENGSFR